MAEVGQHHFDWDGDMLSNIELRSVDGDRRSLKLQTHNVRSFLGRLLFPISLLPFFCMQASFIYLFFLFFCLAAVQLRLVSISWALRLEREVGSLTVFLKHVEVEDK